MRRIAFATALLSLAACALVCHRPAGAADANPAEVRALTFNVLVHWETKPGVPAWDERKDLCAEVLKGSDADLIALQECSEQQTAFFEQQLPGYGVHGKIPITEADMAFFKEHIPMVAALNVSTFTDALLFYREERFELLETGHWWLSPTPGKASWGFGNTFPRIAVWARLKHRHTGLEMVVVSTHFDNTLPSQVHMARLCREKTQPWIDAGLPVMLMGDFNTDQERGDYATLTGDGWRDSYTASPMASETGRDDNVRTHVVGRRIDHIFYNGNALKPFEWARLESPDENRKLSDHYAVFARFMLNP